ncbi:MAG: hypothetical protein KDA63_13050 [Planctomycetales bacterium]|nr:hypothetical protein [Planctomycetales bacterium]
MAGCLSALSGMWSVSVLGAEPSDAAITVEEAAQLPLREVAVETYGVRVQVPAHWRAIGKPRDERAFLLQAFTAGGGLDDLDVCYVACELGIVPASLEEFERRHAAADEREQQREAPRRKLRKCDRYEWAAEPTDMPPELERQRLDCQWEYPPHDDVPAVIEQRSYLVRNGSLYTFILTGPENVFAAQHDEFEAMIRSARFTPADTGLQRLPDGYWMQREFRFAMKLPDRWSPAFAPNDHAVFFATGPTHEVFTDNLIVLAAPAQSLDLAKIRATFPEQLRQADSAVEIEHCEIVKQNGVDALETLIHTKRGPFEITILERRFEGARRNYEVKFTCTTEQFRQQREALYQALETFRELAAADAKPTDL